MKPTPEEVRSTFDYDASTGELLLVKGNRKSPVGSTAGRQQDNGAWKVRINGAEYPRSNLVWVWVNGCWPSGFVCHVNNSADDDRIENLVEMDRPNRSKAERENAAAIFRKHIQETGGG